MLLAWQQSIIDAFKAERIQLIAHVADSILAPIIAALEADDAFTVVTLTREEEGVGILCGAYLGGARGALLLQTSGFGNTINAFGSLPLPYQIPFVVLHSQRGFLSEHNVVQIAGGRAVPAVIEALDIQEFVLDTAETVPDVAQHAVHHAFVARRPVVLTLSTRLTGGKRR